MSEEVNKIRNKNALNDFVIFILDVMKLILFLCSLIPLIQPKIFIIQEIGDEKNYESKDEPPPHSDYARMARWLVHKSEWTAMGTISTVPAISGFPMVNVIAMADSAKDAASTGIIYFYLTMLDFTAQDLSKRNQLTALFSMDQTLYCSKQNVDPMEPTCARVMISGEALRVEKDSEEFSFATDAMLSRHPASVNWLNTHDFFLCKLNMSSICVLDWYGGPHYITTDEYFKANLDSE